jgi:hypothetical protein
MDIWTMSLNFEINEFQEVLVGKNILDRWFTSQR